MELEVELSVVSMSWLGPSDMRSHVYLLYFTFTFIHLADAFIQSDLQIRRKSN